LGGLAQKAPAMAILLVIVALANIALPLTNAFPGEFLMFNGIFGSVTIYNVWFTILAGLGIILGAVYTLNMIRKVFYGDTNALTVATKDITWNEKLALGIIVIIIFGFGIYPQCMLNETAASTELIYKKFELLLQNMQKR
jgi:NADH-quinone oxidoreductase subunit M